MTKQNDTTIFACRGPALLALAEYTEAFERLVSDHEKLQKEFNDKALEQKGVHEAKMREKWVTMTLLVGLDPDKTWQNPAYRVETSYLDEGFGAIVYGKVPNHPLAALTGRGEEDEKLALTEIPEQGMLN